MDEVTVIPMISPLLMLTPAPSPGMCCPLDGSRAPAQLHSRTPPPCLSRVPALSSLEGALQHPPSRPTVHPVPVPSLSETSDPGRSSAPTHWPPSKVPDGPGAGPAQALGARPYWNVPFPLRARALTLSHRRFFLGGRRHCAVRRGIEAACRVTDLLGTSATTSSTRIVHTVPAAAWTYSVQGAFAALCVG